MSRKQQPKDPSGFLFDLRSGAVRAQGGCTENMKEKVQAVRAVVPNRSNTEIVLVLQHFDNAVDRAVQAFMEGKASEVLQEWTVSGKKKNKKKKSKARPQPGEENEEKEEKWEKEKVGKGLEGSEGKGEKGRGEKRGAPRGAEGGRSLRRGGRKGGPGLERSLKELQRCSVALLRFRALLRDEVEASLRRARTAFGEIQSCLMDREVALLAEMDKVKAEAMQLLSLRQGRAESLRALTEAAPAMSEQQLQELREEIKHFVSERKFDEELGRAGRFGCDLEGLRGSIGAFGYVSHPRPSYSSRSRCSSGPNGSTPEFLTGSAPGSTPEFLTGSTPGSTPEFLTGSAPGSAPGSTPEFPTGSTPGSTPEFPTGSAPGSTPEFPTGSTPGSAPAFPGSPEEGAAPQRSRRAPGAAGAAGARPSPPRPPGTNPRPPKNPKPPPKPPQNPKPPPKPPQNPKPPPKPPQNPKIPPEPPRGTPRSCPGGDS